MRGCVGEWVCGLMASPAGWIVGGTRVPGTGYAASRGTACVRYSTRVTSSNKRRFNIGRTVVTLRYCSLRPAAAAAVLFHMHPGRDVLQPVYRDLQFPTREHRSPAVLQVFPGPCTAPHAHPLAHSHTTPHRARTTFGFECHASCPSLSPCPHLQHAFSAAHAHAHSLSCPRTLPLPTLPSAAAAARALAPVPLPHGPFPHCAFPSGSRAPFPHVHSIHVSSHQECLSPVFPPTACT